MQTTPEPNSRSLIPKGKPFDRPTLLRQSGTWSGALIWGIILATSSGLAWALLARVDQTISVQGKLEPSGGVRAVQAPLGGVVSRVLVREGEAVAQGQLLVEFDTRDAESQIVSLGQIRTSLETETRLFQAQLGEANRQGLNANQQQRLTAQQEEFKSRVEAASLEVAQLSKQLNQNRIRLAQRRVTLEVNQGILTNLESLTRIGGYSRIQYLQQRDRVAQLQSEVESFEEEDKRLRILIEQAQARAANTASVTGADLRTRIDNNRKQLADVRQRLAAAQLAAQYKDLHAPVAGTVFDLKARPGSVSSATEPLLKIVPANSLVAKVFVTNKDIGFLKMGQQAEVRVDSFPASEFGSIPGVLKSLGQDALPPDETFRFFRFPATVELSRQAMFVNGKTIPLQSGMSVSVNIRQRERPVITLLTDLFTKQVDSVRQVR